MLKMKPVYILFLMAVACGGKVYADAVPEKVTATVVNASGGSIIAVQDPINIASYTLTAVPEPDYVFLCWVDNGEENTTLGNTTSRSITANNAATYRAVFVLESALSYDDGSVNVAIADASTTPLHYELTFSKCTNDSYNPFSQWSNGQTTNPIDYLEADGFVSPVRKSLLYQLDDGPIGGTIGCVANPCGYTITAIPDEANGYFFIGWSDDVTDNPRNIGYKESVFTAYFTDGKVRGDANYYQTIAEALDADATTIELLEDLSTEDVVIAADKSITMIGNSYSIGNLTIANGGELTLDGDLQCANLYLNTTTGSSSQLHNAVNLQYTQAYIDVAFEAGSVASPDKWYCLGVPFEVDVATGIKRASSEAVCVSGTDYLCWYYDGQYRADTQDGWMIMRSGTMHPGQAYLIGIDGTENTWRFAKKSGATLVQSTNTFNLESYTSSATNITHHNWNTLGNNQLQYISVDGATYVYVYDNEYSYFKNLEADDVSLVVGCPFFVQGTTTVTLVAEDKGPGKRYISPRISESQQSIRMSLTDGKTIDYLYLSTHDDATNDYEIGRDLVKIQAANVAQLWTMAYGYSLAAYDQVPEDNRIIPLTMSAPRNGIYTLSSDRVGDNDVYLLRDNQVLYNLREASYDLELQKGQHTNYALQINKRQTVVTDVDSTPEDEKLGARKFIYHGNLYINHNGKVYTITGELL